MHRLALLFLALIPGPALAQTAVLRSGDHAEFTRLTLPLPAGTGWTLDDAPEVLTLSFSGPLERVDLGQAFRRITRDRVADIRPVPGPGLEILLNCNCAAEAVLSPSNLLILDIRDTPRPVPAAQPSPPPAAPSPEAPLPSALLGLPSGARLSFGTPQPASPAPAAAVSPVVLPAEPPVEPPVEPPQAAPRFEAVPQAPMAETSMDFSNFAMDAINRLPEAPAPAPEAEAALTRELEQQLLQSIGSAATQGLLTPSDSLREAMQDLPPGRYDEHNELHPTDPGVSSTPSTLEADKEVDVSRYRLSGSPCTLAMPPLTTGEPVESFVLELGKLRSALTGEFDRDNAEAYMALGQFYLRNGFGAEAIRATQSVPSNPEIIAEMTAVGRILEYGHDRADGPFAGKIWCEGEASVWAALTGPEIAPGSDFDRAAILTTITALPAPLKSYIGPLLAERFVTAQETGIARDILRIVSRDLPETTPMREFATAQLQTEEQGQPDPQAYDPIIARNDDLSPEALIDFTDATLESGAQVDPETIGLLESYRIQYRDAPLFARLLRSEIMAQASAGNFAASFGLYAEQGQVLDPEVASGTVDQLAGDMARNATDASFTRIYFEHEATIQEMARTETANDVAERLLSLGFAEAAAQLIAPGAEGEAGRQRRLLRTRIALEARDPLGAERELHGMTGPDVDALRASARLISGDFAGAEILFRSAGEDEKAAEAAWLARNWREVQSSAPEPISRVARVVSDQQETPVVLPAAGPPTLATSRDVLSQSGETRAALQDMLMSVQVDTALDE